MATKKAVVLGGTGLLGFATVQELAQRGYDVYSVALDMPSDDLFAGLEDSVHSVIADVNEMTDEEIREKLEGVYALFYAIGADERVLPDAPATRFFYEANVLPTQRLARLAREAGVEKFVVYGSYFAEFAERLHETDLIHEGYPLTRLMQEQVAFAEGDGAMDVTSLRLPYIFGHMPGRMPLWKMFSDQMKQTEVFPVHPGGKTAAVTVKQVAQAAVGAAERGKHRGTYAISEYNLPFTEFYQMFIDKMGLDTKLMEMPYDAVREQMAQLDQHAESEGKEHGIKMELAGELRAMDLSIDPAETKEALGYEDDDVIAAIEETIDYIIEHE
ncbi:NAD-dependent epimerase/dehydratase family protein [Corynebacterium aquatimens]|uniref:NAD-dependent epimerase/dehydratase family protein n=1 Tax=Corynebacterium TaxID=1716 RepID=UPI001F1B87A6|nr:MULTISPECIES: NAD-dependent epimerase/dehydratase family protein [Corynebacterium]QYH19837.1 NAD-dependent epimerase/dehydratase family protein [Corynebacterium aquatimens]UIZ93017.1 NAD-dependent epimerase/dehydratase family protein [Corynebacterium sp. CNCTC7651]